MSTKQIQVAIVGAGLGGLTLARLLQLQKIPVKIYEQESSASLRDQGGSLDMHAESGVLALKKAGLFDEKIKPHARYEAQEMRVLDKDGKLCYEDQGFPMDGPRGEDLSRPEFDRSLLRNTLLESLDEGVVQWGTKIERVARLPDHRFQLFIKNSEDNTVTADLVVGADGAWSTTRKLLTPILPTYSGSTMVELHFPHTNDPDTSAPYKHASEIVGQGSMFALSQDKGLFAHRLGNEDVRVYVALQHPENWVKDSGIDFTNPTATKEGLLKEFGDWSNSLKDLIGTCSNENVVLPPRQLFQLATDFTWESQSGVTLVGDAKNLMLPYAGEGANLAMLDALTLSEEIKRNPGNIDLAIKKYEKKMNGIRKKAAEDTQKNMGIIFQEGSPKPFVELMKSYTPSRLLVFGISIYFFLRRKVFSWGA